MSWFSYHYLIFSFHVVFHDCVSGCDGCINIDNPDNAGLDPAIVALNVTYVANYQHMTIGDFWVVAAMGAINRGIVIANNRCGRGKNVDRRLVVICIQNRDSV